MSQLFLQVTYDVETGSADLRQLSSFDFWDEFKPFDDSGIRINLVGNGQLQPTVATVVQVGTFDLNVPKLHLPELGVRGNGPHQAGHTIPWGGGSSNHSQDEIPHGFFLQPS